MDKKEGVLYLVLLAILSFVFVLSGYDVVDPCENNPDVCTCDESTPGAKLLNGKLCLSGGYVSCIQKDERGFTFCHRGTISLIARQTFSSYGVPEDYIDPLVEELGSNIGEISNFDFYETDNSVRDPVDLDLARWREESLSETNIIDLTSGIEGYTSILLSCSDVFFDWRSSLEEPPSSLWGCEDGHWKRSYELDGDDDGMPRPIDCNDNDANVYGDFEYYKDLTGAERPKIICGDGKANTCGIVQNELDDCDSDSYSCENNCLEDGRFCSWNEQGGCCGNDGVAELGNTGDDDINICLYRPSASETSPLVGMEEPFSDEVWGCDSEWCWVSAGNNPFKVLTINEPGEMPYDVVSNKEKWYSCNSGEGELPSFGHDQENIQTANAFICHQEGDHYAWSQCEGFDDAERQNFGVKGRYPGEGLFSLPLTKEEAAGEIRTISEKVGQIIAIRSDFYEDFYGKDYAFDFSDYNYLNFMVRFCPDEECNDETPTVMEDLMKPAALFLKIYGYGILDNNGNKVPLFKRNVIGDVVGNPIFEGTSFMHIKVPLPNNLKGVNEIVLVGGVSDKENIIKVRNVYLSKEEKEPKLCSGINTISEEVNSWITDIDQGDNQYIKGDKVCEALYGPNAWFGDDDDLGSHKGKANCCGDDQSEYYADFSDDNDYGCWNSVPIIEKKPFTNVEFDVKYNTPPVIGFEYDPVVFEISVEETIVEPPQCPDLFPEINENCDGEEGALCIGQKAFNCMDVDLASPDNTILPNLVQVHGFSTIYDMATYVYDHPIQEFRTSCSGTLEGYLPCDDCDDTAVRRTQWEDCDINARSNNECSSNGDCDTDEYCGCDNNWMSADDLKCKDKECDWGDKECDDDEECELNICWDKPDNPTVSIPLTEIPCGFGSESAEAVENSLLTALGFTEQVKGELYPYEKLKVIKKIDLSENPFFSNFGVLSTSSIQFQVTPEVSDLVDIFFYDAHNGHSLGEPNDLNPSQIILREDDLASLGSSPEIYLMAKYKGNYHLQEEYGGTTLNYYSADSSENSLKINKKITKSDDGFEHTSNFTCLSNECLFPLPGKPPYKITNSHPGYYDLYFVKDSSPNEWILITDEEQEFREYGNVMARKVSLPIVYLNDEENDQQGFFACNAPDYIGDKLTALDSSYSNFYHPKDHCDYKDGLFCSPSKLNLEKGFATVSSWDSANIEEVGYELKAGSSLEPGELDLQLITAATPDIPLPFTAEQRPWKTQAVYGRNLLPNADFMERDGDDILFWDLLPSTPLHSLPFVLVQIKNEVNHVENGVLTIVHNAEILRSDPIPVPQNEVLALSQKRNCPAEIILYDKNGVKIPSPSDDEIEDYLSGALTIEGFDPNLGSESGDLPPIVSPYTGLSPSAKLALTTPNTAYVVITFGPYDNQCLIQEPMLQIIDEDFPTEAAPFFYDEDHRTNEGDGYLRSGLACCPEAYCWNGFACVAPMNDTEIVEYIPKNTLNEGELLQFNRTYRCINGHWKEIPRKTDWNGEKEGFCYDKNQCFVLSFSDDESFLGVTGSKIRTEEELGSQTPFHEQSQVMLPTCLEDGDFIMDHYCQKGNWTSRTKFLAGQLLESVDSDDFTIYCNDPFSTLFERALDDPIEGKVPLTNPTTGFFTEETIESKQQSTCFTITDDGSVETLIPDDENLCINNVCLVTDEDQEITIFATTLNLPIDDDQNSFLESLGLSKHACDAGTPESNGFVQCESGDLPESVWYNPEFQVLVYGDAFDRGLLSEVIDGILDFLEEYLGLPTTRSVSVDLIAKTENFRDIYLSSLGGQGVQAVREKFPKEDTVHEPLQTFVAEYLDYETPFCAFVDYSKLPEEYRGSLLPAEGEGIVCTDGRVESSFFDQPVLDFLWPQFTGKLRKQED